MFIVISGNTCAGKSTLGRALADKLTREHGPTSFVDESSLHSSALRLMFRQPQLAAFSVQCEFLVRRTSRLLAELQRSECVVAERHISDDRLFEGYYYTKGEISHKQHDTYLLLFDECVPLIPEPDLTVYLRCPFDLATARLSRREAERDEPEVPPALVPEYIPAIGQLYEQAIASGSIKADLSFDVETISNDDIVEAVLRGLRRN